MKIQEYKTEIEKVKELIKCKQTEIDQWEPDINAYIDQYEECIDEQGDINIGSLSYTPSYILKNIDPTAYRCGLNDYVDSLDLEPEELISELEELEYSLECLQDELEELQKESAE